MDAKKREILDYLNERIFNVLQSDMAIPSSVRRGLNLTKARLTAYPSPKSIVKFFWSAVSGTDRSIKMYTAMKQSNLVTFEDILPEFRERFNDKWLGES